MKKPIQYVLIQVPVEQHEALKKMAFDLKKALRDFVREIFEEKLNTSK